MNLVGSVFKNFVLFCVVSIFISKTASDHAADQCFFRYRPSTFLIRNFKPLAIFCGRIARIVSNLVGITEDRFSQFVANVQNPYSGTAKLNDPLVENIVIPIATIVPKLELNHTFVS